MVEKPFLNGHALAIDEIASETNNRSILGIDSYCILYDCIFTASSRPGRR